MGWGLAAAWLAVASLVLVTFGTGAQAWANLAEYKSARRAIGQATLDALRGAQDVGYLLSIVTRGDPGLTFIIAAFMFLMPHKLREVRARGGEEAVQMARFLRSAEVWAILMVGSALALVAAAIQLALTYQ
jgi:hypothetical protein